ncbi:uncharacterized protein METZ01_LOCUS339105, partial [marine metagenome]
WLNEDGSGRITLKIGIDNSMLSLGDADDSVNDLMTVFEQNKEMIQDTLKKVFEGFGGIKYKEIDFYENYGSSWIKGTFEFESINSLNNGLRQFQELSKLNEESYDLFDIEITEKSDGEIFFERNLMPIGEDDMEEMKLNPFFKIAEETLKRYESEFTVYFPYRITSANTEGKYIDSSDNKVTWKYDILSLMDSPKTLKATINKTPKKEVIVSNLDDSDEISDTSEIEQQNRLLFIIIILLIIILGIIMFKWKSK